MTPLTGSDRPPAPVRWPGRVVVTEPCAAVFCVDPADAPPPIDGADRLVVVAAQRVAVRGAPVAAWFHPRELRARARELRALAPREGVIHSLESVRLSDVLWALLVGARRIQFTHVVGESRPVSLRQALLFGVLGSGSALLRLAVRSGLPRTFAGWDLAPPLPSRRAVRRSLVEAARLGTRASAAPRSNPLTERPRSIVHYIADLGPGGAERQLTYLAAAQARAGYRVSVLTALPLDGSAGHFSPELTAAGVEVRPLCELRDRLASVGPRRPLSGALTEGWGDELLTSVEGHPARRRVAPLASAVRGLGADLLHCWLDESNAIGALAGQLAGLPRVVLSTRNLSPRHFPRLCREWYRPSYRVAANSPRVRLVANSRAGAEDYAAWCGIDPRRFAVVYNGVDLARLPVPTSPARAALRAALGIGGGSFLVVGVFRLADEKRPFDFLEVVAEAHRRIPGLTVVHVGTGPAEPAVHARARALGLLHGCLRFAGRQPDPGRYLAAADASVLTSVAEGCPNVALESQAVAVPIVLTRAAGAPEAVLDGVSGFVCDIGDTATLAARLVELAGDRPRARAMGERGRAFVAERFSLERMVADTFVSYAWPSDAAVHLGRSRTLDAVENRS